MFDGRSVIALPAFMLLSTPAYAYLGPGMGAGTIAVVLGIVASVFIALFAIVWYPFKRMLKRRKQAATGDGETEAQKANASE